MQEGVNYLQGVRHLVGRFVHVTRHDYDWVVYVGLDGFSSVVGNQPHGTPVHDSCRLVTFGERSYQADPLETPLTLEWLEQQWHWQRFYVLRVVPPDLDEKRIQLHRRCKFLRVRFH